jgi:hypothetical protein
VLANLIDFCRPVQQLLVRVIFLPGISDSSKPIRHIAFRRALRPADAEQPVSEKLNQADTDRLICLSGKHLDTSSRENDFAFPDTATASRSRLTQSLTFAGFTVTFANQPLS